jgi:hypothetical protein
MLDLSADGRTLVKLRGEPSDYKVAPLDPLEKFNEIGRGSTLQVSLEPAYRRKDRNLFHFGQLKKE